MGSTETIDDQSGNSVNDAAAPSGGGDNGGGGGDSGSSPAAPVTPAYGAVAPPAAAAAASTSATAATTGKNDENETSQRSAPLSIHDGEGRGGGERMTSSNYACGARTLRLPPLIVPYIIHTILTSKIFKFQFL
jgi:hypothetical protein